MDEQSVEPVVNELPRIHNALVSRNGMLAINIGNQSTTTRHVAQVTCSNPYDLTKNLVSVSDNFKRTRRRRIMLAVKQQQHCVEKKLKTELNRQDESKMWQHCLVYGTRQELAEELRRLRRELASQLELEPYKVFNNETLDDLVAKLPATEKELIQCRGIAQKRCERYGGAILQVISQYTNEQVNVECSDKSSSSSDEEDDYYYTTNVDARKFG